MLRLKNVAAAVTLLIFSAYLLSGCITPPKITTAPRQISFADYQQETRALLLSQREFKSSDKKAEVLWNSPGEWLPPSSAKPEKGILLVHGLGDSPWTFHDIAPELAARGFLVRTVLLPGHGTHPEDMLKVSVNDWRRVVQEQAEALRHDVGQVYLGGFSTGANLVTEYAYEHPDIAGLVLFSPGFKSMPFDWMAPLFAELRPWVLEPDGSIALQNEVRYMMVPSNGFAQFYHSSRAVRRLLERPYDKPVFMVVAEHDSVLNTNYLLDIFQNKFTNPASRLIWYGNPPTKAKNVERVLVRNDRLLDQRISQFSHMGLLFSPKNTLYGKNGLVRLCFNGQSKAATKACENRETVWYSDWGYSEGDRIYARLTFNPYFDWQTSIMETVFNGPKVGTKTARLP